MPETPPESSIASFPFVLQGNNIAFLISKETNYTLKYSGVYQAIKSGLGAFPSMALRVTHVGVYGKTSTQETVGGNASQSIVNIVDSRTGRSVRGISDYTKRARAGLVLSDLGQVSWYNAGSLSSARDEDIAYLRKTGASICPDDDKEGSSYDIVVRGFCRIAYNVQGCT